MRFLMQKRVSKYCTKRFPFCFSKEVKADLFTWQTFFQEYKGKSFFLDEKWENSVSLQLYLLMQQGRTVLELYLVLTGAMVNCLRNGWVKIMIAIMEFYPIVLSLMLWGDHIRDRCITFFTDNEALVHVINKSTCRDTSLMIFVRTCKLVLVCLKHNILFKAKHISGFKNTLADALSRLQDRTFHENRSTSLHGSHANSNPIPSTPGKLASIVMIFYLQVYRSLQYQRTVGHGSFIC